MKYIKPRRSQESVNGPTPRQAMKKAPARVVSLPKSLLMKAKTAKGLNA